MKGMVKDLGLNLLQGQHTEVGGTKKCCQIICAPTVIDHLTCGLQKLDVVLDSKSSGSWIGDGDKVDEVDQKLDVHKLDIVATRSNGTTDHGQKDQRVGRVSRVVYLIALPAMEAQDHQTAKVETAVVKMPKPVINYPINRCTQVQLMDKGVELNTEVDTLGGEGCLVDVECMSAFVRQHGLVNDWIQIDGGPADVDWHKSMQGKWSTWGGSAQRMVGHGSLIALVDEGKEVEGIIRNSTMSLTTIVICFFCLSNMLLGS